MAEAHQWEMPLLHGIAKLLDGFDFVQTRGVWRGFEV